MGEVGGEAPAGPLFLERGIMNQIIGSEPRPSEGSAHTQADPQSSPSVQAPPEGEAPHASTSCAGEICLGPKLDPVQARLLPPRPWSVRAPLRSIALEQKRGAAQSPRRGNERCVGKTRAWGAHRASAASSLRPGPGLSERRQQKEALQQHYGSEPRPQRRPVPILTLRPYRPPATIGQYLEADLGFWERLVGWCRRQIQGSDRGEK